MIIFCLKFLLSPLACVRETHDEPARRRCCFSPTAEKKCSLRTDWHYGASPSQRAVWVERSRKKQATTKESPSSSEMKWKEMRWWHWCVRGRWTNDDEFVSFHHIFLFPFQMDGWVSCVLSTLEYIYWIWSSLTCSRVELSFTWISQDIVKIHIRWTREASPSSLCCVERLSAKLTSKIKSM